MDRHVLLGFTLLSCCGLLLHLAQAKGGKKLEKTESFDVKPSGSDEHHSIKLVSITPLCLSPAQASLGTRVTLFLCSCRIMG